MKQLIPDPSEGKIRALFGTGKNAIIAKTIEIQQSMKLKQTAATPVEENAYIGQNENSLQDLRAPRRRLQTAGHPIGIMD